MARISRIRDVSLNGKTSAELASKNDLIDVTDLAMGEAFEPFYHREYPGLVALAYALSGSRAHADDLAQEAMLAAYRNWQRVGGYHHPLAWVRKVCANLATSHLRRRGVEARALLRLGNRPVQPAELTSDGGAFWAAVRSLPRRQAQAVALYYLSDCSIADTAAALECAEGTVKSHLSRAREALAPLLAEIEGAGSA